MIDQNDIKRARKHLHFRQGPLGDGLLHSRPVADASAFAVVIFAGLNLRIRIEILDVIQRIIPFFDGIVDQGKIAADQVPVDIVGGQSVGIQAFFAGDGAHG